MKKGLRQVKIPGVFRPKQPGKEFNHERPVRSPEMKKGVIACPLSGFKID